MARVAIITPTYNAEDYLPETIESVIAQSFKDWEMIVVDDGSKDQSHQVACTYAEQDPRIRAIRQKNSGAAAACNHGHRLASPTTEYVMFLDNDDYLEPYALELLVQALDEDRSAPAAYGLPRDVDGQGKPITHHIRESFGYKRHKVSNGKMVNAQNDRRTGFEALVIWPCISTGGQILMRNSALKQTGEFDPSTGPGEDWDLWLRLSLHGSFIYIPRFVLNKRIHERNISKQGSILKVCEPRIRQKLVESAELTPEQNEIARLGHYFSCHTKVLWAKDEITQKRYGNSLRQLYRAFKSYVVYFKVNIRT
jgi:glycosyltransferase involved in cell wall biosynthesis